MKLHAMGIGYHHDKDFHITRPDGSGDDLLVIFRTPAFVTVDGERIEVPPDAAVLYTKTAPQDYGAVGMDYINDWVHFECDENDIFFERLNIKFNAPTPVSSISGAESALRLLIAQTLGGAEVPSAPHSEKLRMLRAEIYGSPSERFTVEGMAARLALSPSYFQTLYRAEFGVSCYEDVLRAKTSLAQYYLANTSISVREIAQLCGFENDVHFMRQFRKRTGQTALEYRRRVSRG